MLSYIINFVQTCTYRFLKQMKQYTYLINAKTLFTIIDIMKTRIQLINKCYAIVCQCNMWSLAKKIYAFRKDDCNNKKKICVSVLKTLFRTHTSREMRQCNMKPNVCIFQYLPVVLEIAAFPPALFIEYFCYKLLCE